MLLKLRTGRVSGCDGDDNEWKRCTNSPWRWPRPICEPQKSNRSVVTLRRWNQKTTPSTTLLFMLPPKGPHGCVTITARGERKSASWPDAPLSGRVIGLSSLEGILMSCVATVRRCGTWSDQPFDFLRSSSCSSSSIAIAILYQLWRFQRHGIAPSSPVHWVTLTLIPVVHLSPQRRLWCSNVHTCVSGSMIPRTWSIFDYWAEHGILDL
jgi:hypothetical protein